MTCERCGAESHQEAEYCQACGAPTGASLLTPTRELEERKRPFVPEALARAVEGKYDVVRLLGKGGMGTVYLAVDLALDRPVALKVLSGDASEQDVRRFLQEARLAAKLRHPNIVSVHAVGEGQGVRYFTMDYIEGETLAAHIARRGPLPPDEARAIIIDVARAVGHAHRYGVIHRDLKPANIMIDGQGHVLTMDFGLAKSQLDSGASTAGSLVGTPQYMSPEQVRGRPATPASDIYALGLVYFFMLTGRDLVSAEQLVDILVGHKSAAQRARNEVSARLDPATARLLLSMLDADPAQRPASLDQILSFLGVGSRPTPRPDSAGDLPLGPLSVPSTVGPTARRASLMAVVGLAGVLLIGALVIWMGRTEETAASRGRPDDRATSSEASAMSLRQITFSGEARLPELSPDGQSVAYLSGPDGALKVVLQDIGSGSVIELLSVEFCQSLRFTHDGSRLLVAGGTWDERHTFVVPRLGGEAQRFDYYPFQSFSPDGSKLACAFAYSKEVGILETATWQRISTVPLTETFLWLHEVAWSPAGSHLAIVTLDDEEKHHLSILPLEGGSARRLVEGAASIHEARFTPGGDGIYYLQAHQRAEELWKVSVESGLSRKLVADLLADSFSLSHDGGRSVLAREQSFANLWRIHPDPAMSRPLTRGTFVDAAPALSPDGRQIAFARGDGQVSDIHVISVDGGAPRRVTFFGKRSGSPAWSPGGEEIAFGSFQNDEAHVWIVPQQGGTARRLERTDLSSNTLAVAWAPATRILYQRPGNRNFSILDLATQVERPLVADESVGWMFDPVPSPDGSRVAVSWNRRPEHGAWIVPLDGGTPARLAGSISSPMGWSSDGKSVFVADLGRPMLHIDRVDVSTNQTTPHLTFERTFRGASCHSVDGSWFVCSLTEGPSDIWLMEGFDPAADAP